MSKVLVREEHSVTRFCEQIGGDSQTIYTVAYITQNHIVVATCDTAAAAARRYTRQCELISIYTL